MTNFPLKSRLIVLYYLIGTEWRSVEDCVQFMADFDSPIPRRTMQRWLADFHSEGLVVRCGDDCGNGYRWRWNDQSIIRSMVNESR